MTAPADILTTIICKFAERMEQNGNTVIPLRSSLPEQCYVFVQTENCVGIVKKGESGFYRTDIQGGKPSETNALVNEMNKKLGLSKGQAEAMKAGSMFGWNTPAADPKSYDKNGIPVRPHTLLSLMWRIGKPFCAVPAGTTVCALTSSFLSTPKDRTQRRYWKSSAGTINSGVG